MSNEISKYLQKFFNSFYSKYKHNYRKFIDVFLRAYERDTRGLSDIDKLLVKDLNSIINMLRAVRIDTLHEMRDFILRYRINYKYVYVVDCLGLPELYALWCRASKVGFMPIVRVFVNQKATTRAFKEVFGDETLGQVAEDVGGLVFRKLDTLLHSEIFKELKSRNESVELLVGRMRYVVSLLPLMKDNIMIFSDHGYDVIRIDSKYIAKHTHIRRTRIALAKLAPVMLLKRIR